MLLEPGQGKLKLRLKKKSMPKSNIIIKKKKKTKVAMEHLLKKPNKDKNFLTLRKVSRMYLKFKDSENKRETFTLQSTKDCPTLF
jgi:hypothetical protein